MHKKNLKTVRNSGKRGQSKDKCTVKRDTKRNIYLLLHDLWNKKNRHKGKEKQKEI